MLDDLLSSGFLGAPNKFIAAPSGFFGAPKSPVAAASGLAFNSRPLDTGGVVLEPSESFF